MDAMGRQQGIPAVPIPSLKSTKACLLQSLTAILPRWLRYDHPLSTKQQLHPTSYLDALRGYAALAVVNAHHFPFDHHPFWNLPFVNIIKSGKAMVQVFFVISGYVLSQRLLQLIRDQEYHRVIDHLASATFRRYLRLFMSCFAATFFAMILVWMDLYKGPGVPHRYESFTRQVQDWLIDCSRLGNPFIITGFFKMPGPGVANSRYIFDLWTIPVEYVGSMVVYMFCTASCKLSSRNRMLLCSCIISLCYYWKALYAALFLMGTFLAELNLERNSKQTTLPSVENEKSALEPTPHKPQLLRKVFYAGILIVSLFLLSRNDGPFDKEHTVWYRPWPFLNRLTPQSYRNELESSFYPSFGAFLLVWALDACPALQRPLTWKYSQFLGELSFGIYIVHLFILFGLDEKVIMPWRVAWLGQSAMAKLPEMLLCYALIFWAAEVFSRVDTKAVGFGRWLQTKLFV